MLYIIKQIIMLDFDDPLTHPNAKKMYFINYIFKEKFMLNFDAKGSRSNITIFALDRINAHNFDIA